MARSFRSSESSEGFQKLGRLDFDVVANSKLASSISVPLKVRLQLAAQQVKRLVIRQRRIINEKMEALFGIVGKDFVLTASDNLVARSIMVMKTGQDKSTQLTPHCQLSYSGEPGDSVNFSEFIRCNLQLYSISNSAPLSTAACAKFTRRQIAESLRTRNAYQTQLLIAGWDKDAGGELYWIDYMGSMTKTGFAAHGYAAFLTMGLMDRHWRKGMELQETIDLLKLCFKELKTRLIVNFDQFIVRVIDKDGIRDITI